MAPQWSEIRTRAAVFAQRWIDEEQENAGAQSFWTEFLAIYGLDRKRIARFEEKVKGLGKGSGRGRIDMLWPGVFMAEHKSAGRDLDDALQQALDYVDVLEKLDRPRFIAVSDFKRLRLYEVATGQRLEFALDKLPDHVEAFAFLIGRELRHQADSIPVNVAAAREMGKLHDLLEASGYRGHQLELLLVRLLFCLFADDTGLFDQRGVFQDLINDFTHSSGQDLGLTLAKLFQVLNTPVDRRQAALPEQYKLFPYVNGQLFAENIDLADFDPQMRSILLEACKLDWGDISPAIFGSMFQSVMDKDERRNLGAHYTSEENILKAIGPLFLDDLTAQREAARGSRAKLQAFLDFLPRIKLLDPACGSGNFLITAYRELRRLELSALQELLKGQQILDISTHIRVGVEQFYGIEYDEFPSQIARVAMWLTDHQCNVEASRALGRNFINLPLSHAAHVRQGDALEVDWFDHLELDREGGEVQAVYVAGNPPFIGYNLMGDLQHDQIKRIFAGTSNAGRLDFVAGWYALAAEFLERVSVHLPNARAGAALVSTNSVAQGEQVAPIWGKVLRDHHQHIAFAHQTFKWTNDAPGQAAVHCVIVGFGPASVAKPRLFAYATVDDDPVERTAKRINAYLIDGPDVLVDRAKKPLRTGVPDIYFGSMARDGGHLIFHTQAERDELLRAEPDAAEFIRPFVDAQDQLNGKTRWCLWLKDADPGRLRRLPKVMERVARVREFRLESKAASTRQMAQTPTLFGQIAHRGVPSLIVPRHSSERREYIPFLDIPATTIASDATLFVPGVTLFHFGVMQSRLHMDWMRLVSGRIKSDYRYSKDLSYNAMPWPDRSALTSKQVTAVEAAAQAVKDARLAHPKSTLSDLYDPMFMPVDLRKAHNALDKAVEDIYGIKPGGTEDARLAVLLSEYQKLVQATSAVV